MQNTRKKYTMEAKIFDINSSSANDIKKDTKKVDEKTLYLYMVAMTCMY